MDVQMIIGFVSVFLVAGAISYVGYTFAKMAQDSLNKLINEELKLKEGQ